MASTDHNHNQNTALMLPGGGARGAYQVGVLKAIAEFNTQSTGNPDINPFPIICGTSAGAINAGVLGSYACHFNQGVTEMEKVWGEMRSERIFHTDVITTLRYSLRWFASMYLGFFGFRPPRSLLNNAPLAKLLSNKFIQEGVQKAIKTGVLHALAINASGYTRSSAISFFQGHANIQEWRRGRREGLRAPLDIQHLLASSALPVIFPAAKIGNEYYGDGGMRQTAPLSAPIHLCAKRILVITTRNQAQDEVPDSSINYPSLGEIGGAMMDIIFMDNLNADIDRLIRVNELVDKLTPKEREKSNLHKIDVLMIEPSADVRDIAYQHSHEVPNTLRFMLRRFGASGDGSRIRLPSYLLFERGFCQALIRLGYQDAMAQRDKIQQFLGINTDT